MLKGLSGTDWGHATEDLLLTYKCLGKPLIDYAAPIYSPNLKPTNVKKLQTAQNVSEDHLHVESQVMPVDDHLQLLNSS